MENISPKNDSPRWGTTTKTVIGFTVVAIVAALLVKFQSIIPPLILAFILVYLLYPLTAFVSRRLRLGWGLAVALVYILVIILLLGVLTFSGYELIAQLQSLVVMVESSLDQIPALVDQVGQRAVALGVDLSVIDLDMLSTQLIENVQPLLGQTGALIGTLASSAMSTLGWTAFVLLVSFFLLLESGGLREGILPITLPRYGQDVQRMGQLLGRIWNAFLRGQIILIAVATLIYSLVLSVLGVRYALGLAIMAGAARFLPYVGPAISWTVLALVAFFQTYKPFGLTPLLYTLIILSIAWVIDGILDNIVSPRIMAHALRVHPAAVMVAAIIALELLGVLGVIIAAPMLATIKLVGDYVMAKMFDLNPWDNLGREMPEPPPLREQFRAWLERIGRFFQRFARGSR